MATTYYVSFEMGCTLVEAEDEECAEAYIRREYGRAAGRIDIREATEADRSWVKGFSGITHKARKP